MSVCIGIYLVMGIFLTLWDQFFQHPKDISSQAMLILIDHNAACGVARCYDANAFCYPAFFNHSTNTVGYVYQFCSSSCLNVQE
jgi:hypothetical protein